MDETASVMDFFRIYFSRIDMSEQAAEFLGCSYKLYINDVLINAPRPLGDIDYKKIIDDADLVELK